MRVRGKTYVPRLRPQGTGFQEDLVIDNAFGQGKGRMYGRWIDSVNGSARSNGHNENDLIEEPGGVIESLLRDEIFVERDLEITSSSAVNTAVVSGLRSSINNFYNYSIWYNVTTGHKTWVNSYVGSTKTITIQDNDASMAAGDKVFITNVQGDNKINYQSFDVLGNTTNGLRKDWKFARSIYNEVYAGDLIDSLLYESRCILFTSYNQYKIKALDEASSADTWTTPLKINGNEAVNCSLTHISQLYNDYRVNYHFDYGSQEYKKTLFVNKSGYTSTLTNGSTYQTTCKTIYDNYKVLNKFEYNCNWIYDDDTAELFFDKIFTWYSKQRLIVNWLGDVGTYLKYEVGDQVMINNPRVIPTGVNNSSKFIIMANPLTPDPGSPFISFSLLEVS